MLRRALKIEEAKRGMDDPQVAETLPELGRYVREARQPGEAEALLRRALEIKEAELGTDDPQVATVLEELGRLCARDGAPGGRGRVI